MDPEFEEFMSKVDNVDSIIRGLRSTNIDEVKNASRRAEAHLNQLKSHADRRCSSDDARQSCDKTSMNMCGGSVQQGSLSPEDFMMGMVQDAKERAADKQRRKGMSDFYKMKGNEAYRKQDYVSALDMYDKAINEIKDSCVLYTNRALTCLNLGLNLRVLEDCCWVHKLDDGNLRAWLYKARAHHNLGQADECEACIQAALDKHPSKTRFIQGYEHRFLNNME